MYLALIPTWDKYREAHAACDEALAPWHEAPATWNEARAALDKVHAAWREARAAWETKVHEVCGSNASIEWSDEGCTVCGVMVFLYAT